MPVLAPTPARRIRVEGEVKAEAPPRAGTVQPTAASVASSLKHISPERQADLPDLRDFIRSRRAALAGFMEQGAALALNGDVLTVIPRNDIYIRYLSDNRASSPISPASSTAAAFVSNRTNRNRCVQQEPPPMRQAAPARPGGCSSDAVSRIA